MNTHIHGQKGHSELAGIPPRLTHREAKIREMEDVVSKAFTQPNAVLDEVRANLRGSANPERVLSRYYALFDTLFKEKVFQDNDRAWEKLNAMARPESSIWGTVPDGMGFAVFGMALKKTQNPDGVLDSLMAVSELSPEVKEYRLTQIPPVARTLHVLATSWSDKYNLGLPLGETYRVSSDYPNAKELTKLVEIATHSLTVCQNPLFLEAVRKRAKVVAEDGGKRGFDNELLWEHFLKGTAEAPRVVELLLKYKALEARGESPSSIDRVVHFLEAPENKVPSASICIEPAVGLIVAGPIGTGHIPMLTEYGVHEADKGRFLPGTVSVDKGTGNPFFQITGGLADMTEREVASQLSLACNHLIRWGFDPGLEIVAFIGAPDAFKGTIGKLSEGVNVRTLARERVKETLVRSLADLGDYGHLVLDFDGSVWDIRTGSVIQSTKNVLSYCFYRREDDKVMLYDTKAKHFDTSSDQRKVATHLRTQLGSEGDKVVESGEFVVKGQKPPEA